MRPAHVKAPQLQKAEVSQEGTPRKVSLHRPRKPLLVDCSPPGPSVDGGISRGCLARPERRGDAAGGAEDNLAQWAMDAAGMSTRAIAPVVGVKKSQVSNDLREEVSSRWTPVPAVPSAEATELEEAPAPAPLAARSARQMRKGPRSVGTPGRHGVPVTTHSRCGLLRVGFQIGAAPRVWNAG